MLQTTKKLLQVFSIIVDILVVSKLRFEVVFGGTTCRRKTDGFLHGARCLEKKPGAMVTVWPRRTAAQQKLSHVDDLDILFTSARSLKFMQINSPINIDSYYHWTVAHPTPPRSQ